MKRAIKSFLFFSSLLFLMISKANAACEPVKISFSENWFPLSYYDSGGNPTGIAIDIHREIFQSLDIDVEFIGGIPWTRQLKILENGGLDALAAVNYNPDRAEKFLLSDPFHSFNVRAFALKGSTKTVQTIQDLANYKVAYSRGASFGKEFDQLAAENEDIIPVNGTDTIINVLLGKRVDFIVLPEALGKFLIHKAGHKDKIEATGPTIHKQDVHFAFSRQSECKARMNDFNDQLHQFEEDGFINETISIYTGTVN